MLPFGIGFSEIIVVFLVLIVFVGPEGIPQVVKTIAKVIRTVRSMIDEIKYSEEFDDVKREILQPLEEARKFNPRQKAESWVKNELEQPLQNLTKEHVDDFKIAMNSLDNQKKNNADKPARLDTSSPEGESSSNDHKPKSAASHHSADELNHGEEEEEEIIYSAQDPLERGLKLDEDRDVVSNVDNQVDDSSSQEREDHHG